MNELASPPAWQRRSMARSSHSGERYGRLLRWMWAELDGSRAGPELVTQEIVRAGYATVATYPPDVKYVDLLLKAERYARENRLVLWGACPTRGGPPPGKGNCDPAYPTVCIPSPPPDLDCGDIPYRRFEVQPPDPTGSTGPRWGGV